MSTHGDMCGIGQFALEIQAIYTLQRAMELNRANKATPDNGVNNEGFWQLDSHIQLQINETLSMSQTNSEHAYAVLTILLLSVIELHKGRLEQSRAQNNITEDLELSRAALETTLNMVQHLLRVDGPGKILDVRQMPWTAVPLLQLGGLTALLLDSQYGRKASNVFDDIIEALIDRAGRRWAGAELIRLELMTAWDTAKI
ncbi:hypothetical protein HJFPF1_13398 [Paramyrothecium foliicola]|nr:hypothetical protein HJFPF1_13398 [Paramyrothecium foliicola]